MTTASLDFTGCSGAVWAAYYSAQELAAKLQNPVTTEVHLLSVMLASPELAPTLAAIGIDRATAQRRTEKYLAVFSRTEAPPTLSPSLVGILDSARQRIPASLTPEDGGQSNPVVVELLDVLAVLVHGTMGLAREFVEQLGFRGKRLGGGPRPGERLRRLGSGPKDRFARVQPLASPLPRIESELLFAEIPGLTLDCEAARMVVGRARHETRITLSWEPSTSTVLLNDSSTIGYRRYVSHDAGSTWTSTSDQSDLEDDLSRALERLVPEIEGSL